jgi:Bacterial PH domain
MNGEYDYEPIPGLPEKLPEGERILWQGAPRWQHLATDAYLARLLGGYFALLLAWRVVHGVTAGESIGTVLQASAGLLVLAVLAVGLLTLLAWLSARTTLYTITNRRVVIRHGIALPMTVNLPFNVVESGALKTAADGHGEIALALSRDTRIGYLLTWPHVRRWRITRPQPALRGLPAAARVASVLTEAMAQAHGAALVTAPVPGSTAAESGIALRPRTSVAA